MLPQRTQQPTTILAILWHHWLRAWWPWHWTTARLTLVYRYQECRCGYRRYKQVEGCYSPLDQGWLRTGKWTPRPTEFPKATSGVHREGRS